MELVDPALHKCYSKVVNKEDKRTTEERFSAITKGEYQLVGSKRISQSSGSMILLSAIGKIPAKEDVQQHQTYSPKHILTELEAQFPKGWEQTVKRVRRDLLLHRSSSSYFALPSSTLREEVISGVLAMSSISTTSITALHNSTSTEHPHAHMLPIQWKKLTEYQQVFVFEILSRAITGTGGENQRSYFTAFSSTSQHHDHTTLILRGAQYLTDSWLMKILQQSKHSLVFLDIRDCPLLSFTISEKISQLCPNLKIFRHELHRNKGANYFYSLNNAQLINQFSGLTLDSGRSIGMAEVIFERMLNNDFSPEETGVILNSLQRKKVVNIEAIREAILLLVGSCYCLGYTIDVEYVLELDKLLSQLCANRDDIQPNLKLILIGYLVLLLYKNIPSEMVMNHGSKELNSALELAWHTQFAVDQLCCLALQIDVRDKYMWKMIDKLIDFSIAIPKCIVLLLLQDCLGQCNSDQVLITEQEEYPSLLLCLHLLFSQQLDTHDQLKLIPLLSYYDATLNTTAVQQSFHAMDVIELDNYVDILIVICKEAKASRLTLSHFAWIGVGFPYLSSKYQNSSKIESLLQFLMSMYEWASVDSERLAPLYGSKLILTMYHLNTEIWLTAKLQDFISSCNVSDNCENKTLWSLIKAIADMDDTMIHSSSFDTVHICMGLVLMLLKEVQLRRGNRVSDWTTCDEYLLQCLQMHDAAYTSNSASIARLKSPMFLILLIAVKKVLTLSKNRFMIFALFGDYFKWTIQIMMIVVVHQFQKLLFVSNNNVVVTDNLLRRDQQQFAVKLSHILVLIVSILSGSSTLLPPFLEEMDRVGDESSGFQESDRFDHAVSLTKLENSPQRLICDSLGALLRESSKFVRLSDEINGDIQKFQTYLLIALAQLLQRDGLPGIINLISISSRKPLLIDWLLKDISLVDRVLNSYSIPLLQCLMKVSATPAILRCLFQSLCCENISNLGISMRTKFVVDVLKGLFDDIEHPKNCFLFEGRASGILLPPFKQWPATNGHTFCTWLSFQDWDSEKFRRFKDCRLTIFSVVQSNGIECEVYIRPRVIGAKCRMHFFVTVTSSANTIPIENSLGVIDIIGEKKWHYFSISHSKGGIMGRSIISSVINDEKPIRVEVSYPKFGESVIHAGIGTVYENKDEATHRRTSFYGRMSTVFIFAEPLTAVQLQQIKQLGYNNAHEVCCNLEDFRMAGLESNIHTALALVYNPAFRRDDIVYETSATIERDWHVIDIFKDTNSEITSEDHSTLGSSMNAKLLAETFTAEFRSMRTALDALGGLKVLFPLFHTTQMAEDDYSCVFPETLNVFICALRDSTEDKHFMIEYGFAFLIKSVASMNPVLVTTNVVESFIALFDKYANDDEWGIKCMEIIFFDFRVWSRTSFACQEIIWKKVYDYAGSHVDVIKSRIGLTKLIQGLYFYFVTDLQAAQRTETFFKEEIVVISTNKELPNDQSKSIILREMVFDIIFVVITNTGLSIESEIKEFICYVLVEPDTVFKVVALRWFLKLLLVDDVEFISKVIESFRDSRLLYGISELTGHSEAGVRIHGWLVLCTLLYSALYVLDTNRNNDIFKILGIEVNTMTHWLRELVSKTHDRLSNVVTSSASLEIFWLFQILQRTFFGQGCRPIIDIFGEITSLRSGSDNCLRDDLPSESFLEEILDWTVSMDVNMISIPMLFPILIELLKSSFITIDKKIQLLSVITKQFCSIENNDILLSIPHWQLILLDLACSTTDCSMQPDDPNCVLFQNCLATLFSNLHLHAFLFGQLTKNRPYRIVAPRAVKRIDYVSLSANEVMRLVSQESRETGDVVLRKTIGCIRCRVLEGLMDCTYFGTKVLSAILEQLHQMIDNMQRQQPVIDSSVKGAILRLEMQELVFAQDVCEFVAIPPVRSASNKIGTSRRLNTKLYQSNTSTLVIDLDTVEEELDNFFIRADGNCSVEKISPESESYETKRSTSQLDQHGNIFELVNWLLRLLENFWGKLDAKASRSSHRSINSSLQTTHSILSMLCNIYLSFILTGMNQSIIDMGSVPFKAVHKLICVLNWMSPSSSVIDNHSALLVVAKLSLAIRNSNVKDATEFVKYSIALTKQIISRYSRFLTKGMIAQAKNSVAPIADDLQQNVSQSHYLPINFSELGELTGNMVVGYQLPTVGSELVATPPDTSLKVMLEKAITDALHLPNDVPFSWMDWENLMEQIIKQFSGKDKVLLASRLNEMGLHKHTLEVSDELMTFERAEGDARSVYRQSIEEENNRICNMTLKQMRELTRDESKKVKPIHLKLVQLLTEQYSQYGVWGRSGEACDNDQLVSV